MLVPREVLEKVGLFDPELFAYSEDTDWSLRAREDGYRHYVVPASSVWHKVSAASGGESSPTALYYDLRNALVVAERHAPLGALGTWRRRGASCSARTSPRPCARRAVANVSPLPGRGGATSARGAWASAWNGRRRARKALWRADARHREGVCPGREYDSS